jgi:PAS domain S-box-containing protein
MFVEVNTLDRVSDGIMVLDPSGTIDYLNDAAAEMLRQSREVLLGANIWSSYPGDHAEMLAEKFNEATHAQAEVEFELGSSRSGRWYLIRIFPGRNGLTVIARDMTERRHDELAQAASLVQARRLQRLATVLAETNEAVFRATTPRGLFEAAVSIAVHHGGFVMSWIGVVDEATGEVTPVATAGEGAARYLQEVHITTDEDDPRGRGVGGIALRTGRDVCSNDILSDQNMKIWQSTAATVGYRSSGAFPLVIGGRVAGLLSVYTEEPGFFNTDEVLLVRRLASNVAFGWESLMNNEALRESEIARRTGRRFRAVLSAAPDAIIGIDPISKHIELVNVQAERLFGWSMEELTGRPIEDLLPEVSREIGDLLRDAQRHQVAYFLEGHQSLAHRRDGSTFQAEIALSSVESDDGRMMVLASVRDLTERIELENERRRHELEAQREQTDRLESLGKLAGGVAHDFNNLLGVILNYTSLLSREVVDERARADIGEIRTAAQRGAELTRQLLTFARRDQPNPEALDLNACIRATSAMLRRTLGSDIEFVINLAEGSLVTEIDRQQLDQIILNLVINARDAMQDGGTLTITTERVMVAPHGEIARFCIADTGSGMTPEVISRVFEPFFTTKPRGQGTGLGLAVVYGIVNRCGGSIEIQSELGHGSTICVHLPLVNTTPTLDERADLDGRGGLVSNGERVLLVEDDDRLRDATARILREGGFEVVSASDGMEALEILEVEHHRISVVLSDVVMPRMSGKELLRVVRERFSHLGVVLMSGYDSGETDASDLALVKPVVEEDLFAALRREIHG